MRASRRTGPWSPSPTARRAPLRTRSTAGARWRDTYPDTDRSRRRNPDVGPAVRQERDTHHTPVLDRDPAGARVVRTVASFRRLVTRPLAGSHRERQRARAPPRGSLPAVSRRGISSITRPAFAAGRRPSRALRSARARAAASRSRGARRPGSRACRSAARGAARGRRDAGSCSPVGCAQGRSSGWIGSDLTFSRAIARRSSRSISASSRSART